MGTFGGRMGDRYGVTLATALNRLLQLVGDPQVGPAAQVAVYCVRYRGADAATLLAVIEAAQRGWQPLTQAQRDHERYLSQPKAPATVRAITAKPRRPALDRKLARRHAQAAEQARPLEAEGRHPLFLTATESDYRRAQLPELLDAAGEENFWATLGWGAWGESAQPIEPEPVLSRRWDAYRVAQQKDYNRNRYRREHELVPTTPCPVCGRSFVGERGLYVHLGKAHPEHRAAELVKRAHELIANAPSA